MKTFTQLKSYLAEGTHHNFKSGDLVKHYRKPGVVHDTTPSDGKYVHVRWANGTVESFHHTDIKHREPKQKKVHEAAPPYPTQTNFKPGDKVVHKHFNKDYGVGEIQSVGRTNRYEPTVMVHWKNHTNGSITAEHLSAHIQHHKIHEDFFQDSLEEGEHNDLKVGDKVMYKGEHHTVIHVHPDKTINIVWARNHQVKSSKQRWPVTVHQHQVTKQKLSEEQLEEGSYNSSHKFKPGDRVSHNRSGLLGTVTRNTPKIGKHVHVRWDTKTTKGHLHMHTELSRHKE